jgi:nucleoside 2-deoxyribosyltransferase
MNPKLVYLAGPISQLTYQGATDWRKHASSVLEEAGRIRTLDPMRGKRYLEDVTAGRTFQDVWSDSACAYPGGDFPLSTQHGITHRDRWDVRRSDLVLLNLEGAKQISIGTMLELAWADAAGVYTLAVIEGSGNPHHHGMVLETASLVVETLDQALDLIPVVLGV